MSLTTLVNQLNAAGSKYNVPSQVLLGVFGMETGFGNNVATSSAGAQGLMQFIPATAATYGYPLTNNPTPAQAQQQFDAAAHYISDLYKQHGGNMDAALRAYSGGGYGLAQVQAKAQSGMGIGGAAQNFGGIPQTGPNVGVGGTDNPSVPDVPGAISGLGQTISGAFNQAVTDAKYAAVLIGALVIAVVLMTHGITGQTPAGVARRAPA